MAVQFLQSTEAQNSKQTSGCLIKKALCNTQWPLLTHAHMLGEEVGPSDVPAPPPLRARTHTQRHFFLRQRVNVGANLPSNIRMENRC